MNRDEIIDRLGAETWGQVLDAYGGLDRAAILAALDDMFTLDDNTELADAIADVLERL